MTILDYHQLKADEEKARDPARLESAVRTKSEELLRLAVVSLAINDFTCGDARDAIVSLGSVLVAAREIGLDWSAVVRGVAAVSGPGMAALFQDFLANHPS